MNNKIIVCDHCNTTEEFTSEQEIRNAKLFDYVLHDTELEEHVVVCTVCGHYTMSEGVPSDDR